jgi:hypothetical protein
MLVLKKEETSQINDLNFHVKKLEKKANLTQSEKMKGNNKVQNESQ